MRCCNFYVMCFSLQNHVDEQIQVHEDVIFDFDFDFDFGFLEYIALRFGFDHLDIKPKTVASVLSFQNKQNQSG